MKLRILQLGLVICWLCVISTAAIAQTLYDLDNHIQQPEYTPVNVFDKPTVDSQGNLNLSYTLGQVESHGFSYPISFHYQSGIKALVPANWIGLGWSFNPGGITRIPAVGNPKSWYNMVRNGDPDYLGIDPFDPAGQSALPDLFEVVIPGKGSSQMMQILRPNYASSTIPGYTTDEFAPLDQNGWKIQYQSAIQTIAGKTTGIYSDDFILQSQKADFSKFLITTPDGMSYLFASPTLGFTSLREKSGVAYFNRNQIHVQTWRLVAIFGAEYTGDRWQVPLSTNAQPWMKLDYGPVLSAIHNQTGAFRQTQYLTSISSPVASATFSSSDRYEPMLPWWERSAGFNDTQKKLTSITFSFKGSSSHKTITLAHDNSFSPTPPSNPDKGRLKLLSLNDSSTEGLDYSFSYYAPTDSIKWNGYTTADSSSFTGLFVDYYGFFNKSTQAVLYNTNGDAPSSQNESESWSLASVSYNTGLKDSIFYEARFLGASQKATYKKAAFSVIEDLNYDPMDKDSFNTGGTYLAGPRVAAIFRDSRYDAFSTQANQLFTYQYLFPTIGAAPITYLVELLGSNQLNIANYAREAIHYQEIRAFQHQSVGSYNPANPLPPTEKTTKYTYQAAAANNAVVDTDSFGNPPNQSTGVYFTQDLPSPIDWKLTGVFELSSDMANADEQSYEVAEFGASNADSMATSWGVQASGSITANFKLAKVKSSRGQLASTRKQLADQLEHYAYTYEPQTGLLRERHRLQSGVGKPYQVQRYTYGFEQYPALQGQNLLSAVIRTDDGLASAAGLVSWKSAQVTTWALATDPADDPLAYQANGNVQSQRWRQSMNLRSSALQYNYAYNAVDFLTSAAFSGGGYSSSAYDVTELAYDLDGNFTRIRRNNQTGVGLRSHLNLSYSAGTNKISQMEDPNPIDFYNFGYDAAGNINLASHLSLSGASYDERNLPVEFNYQVNKRLDMGYDAAALRIYKANQLGNTTHFVRDVNGSVLASYYNGALRYHGLLGPDGSLFGQADGTSRYYFLKDHPSVDGQVLGSVRTTVDFNNTALGYDPDFHRGRFYPFEFRRGGMPGRSSSSSTPDDDYKFTGHQRDAELDLDYMLARNYDPLIGRFMQVDPLAIDYPAITPYGYVLNNPLGLVDPTGMAATDPPFGSGWLNSLVKQLEGYYMGVNTFNDRNYVNTMQSGIANDLGNAAYFGGNMVVDATATSADFVSDGSTLTAAGGIGLTVTGGIIVATGIGAVPGAAMMSTGATITGTALTVGNVADATSLAAKSIDAAAFNGSIEAATNQLIETTLNFGISKMANKVAGSFIRTNSAGRFINSSNGQFVSNRYSFGITATRDATSIIVPLASPNKTGKIGGN